MLESVAFKCVVIYGIGGYSRVGGCVCGGGGSGGQSVLSMEIKDALDYREEQDERMVSIAPSLCTPHYQVNHAIPL